MSGEYGKQSHEKRPRRWLWALAVFLWTLVIWGHSLLPASQSSAESGQVLALLEPLLRLTGLAPELWHTAVRKCAHMAEFAVLGGFWSGMTEGETGRFWDKLLTVVFACMTTALLDETIQLFRPGRSGQISDVWVDLCGAAVGVTVTAAWRKLRAKV